MHKYNELRNTYPNFYYHSFTINETDLEYEIVYNFEIEGLRIFNPRYHFDKRLIVNKDREVISSLVFHIGLIELVSYWKCTCSPNVIIEAGELSIEQINWFKKLYYLGQGEFRYVNGIDDTIDWMNITSSGPNYNLDNIDFNGSGNLVCVGGGKDSTVSLELLKDEDNLCFMINPKEPSIMCTKVNDNDYFAMYRELDKGLLELNSEGFLNGHTPFSSLVAFVSLFVSYLTNRKYIVLSNEGSANEATVIGTEINHQYSKTYEFEDDFNNYVNKYLNLGIHYFSFLRPLNELQIAMLFSNYKQYHHIFKSCNVGSKSIPWVWCNKCPKCLFVYIILGMFLEPHDMIDIFGVDMYQDHELLDIFKELLGYAETKPFECVGTYSEVRFAVSKTLDKYEELPILLKYFKDNYPLSLEHDFRLDFNEENHVPEEFLNILRKELNSYVSKNIG